jgi:hypothetical protein
VHPQQPAPGPPPYGPPPPRRSNKGLVIALVVVALILVCGCVGTLVAIPVLGPGLYTSVRDRSAQAIAPIKGDWASRDGTVKLHVSDYGDLVLDGPAFCYAHVTQPADHRYAFHVDTDPCGTTAPLGRDGTLVLNSAGDQLTLTDGAYTVVLIRRSS